MANDLQTSEKQDVLQANELLSVNLRHWRTIWIGMNLCR